MYAILSFYLDEKSLQKDLIRTSLHDVLAPLGYTTVMDVLLVSLGTIDDFRQLGQDLEALYRQHITDFDYILFSSRGHVRPTAIRTTWPGRGRIRTILGQ